MHAADVLAMAAPPAGDAVFATGIDPQLALYKRVLGNKGQLRQFHPPPRCMLRLARGQHSRSHAGQRAHDHAPAQRSPLTSFCQLMTDWQLCCATLSTLLQA